MKRLFCLIFLMYFLSVYPQADSNTYDVPDTYYTQYSMADSFLQAGKVTQSIPLFRALMKGQDESHHVFFRADVMTGLNKSYEVAGKHDSAFAITRNPTGW